MTANIPSTRSDDPLARIEQKLDVLSSDWDKRFDSISNKVEAISNDVETLSDKVERSNDKFDNYQKATQWVVQLAFTLIASATVTIIFSFVLRR
jgi:outer membrane murein-binding lipoprotein Lpp